MRNTIGFRESRLGEIYSLDRGKKKEVQNFHEETSMKGPASNTDKVNWDKNI